MDGFVNCFDRFTGTAARIAWEGAGAKLRGVARLSNRFGDGTYTLTARETGDTHAFQLTGALDDRAAAALRVPIIEFARAELKGKLLVAASGAVTWPTAVIEHHQVPVPVGKIGYIFSFNPGAAIEGTAHYNIYRHDPRLGGHAFIRTAAFPVTAYAPAESSRSFKHVLSEE